MGLILINKNDISVGTPIAWPLYDEQRNCLLEQGDLIRDNEHCENLLARGACREMTLDISNQNLAPEDAFATDYSQTTEPNQGNSNFTFDDMKLKVDSRLMLEPPLQLGRDRLPIKVLGYMKGTSLMVSAPMGTNNLRLQLRENERVVLRSFSGQSAFGFSCTIQKIIKLPFEYMHLSFPDKIQGIMVRRAPRIKTRIIAAVNDENGNLKGSSSALISNISADGLALDAKQILGKKGDSINMAFRVKLHKIDASLSIKGLIRAVLNDGSADSSNPEIVRHGIEFQNIQPNDSIILQSMIYQQIIENPQHSI